MELAEVYGGDLSLAPAGDLATVSGTIEGRQRVLRRVLTQPGNYIWEPGYGGGVPEMIGTTSDAKRIEGTVRAQMLLETAVAQNPPPVVTVTNPEINAAQITLQYQDAQTGDSVPLGVTLS